MAPAPAGREDAREMGDLKLVSTHNIKDEEKMKCLRTPDGRIMDLEKKRAHIAFIRAR